MAIQSASATFTRFYVPDPPTEDFWNFVDEHLRAGCFRELTGDQEQAIGFSSWDDLFDTTFAYASYHKGQYAAFHFRYDQRRVPAIIVKQYLRAAVTKFKEENEGRRPSRQQYQQLREETQSMLLRRALPRPAACDVVWNPEDHWLLYGSTNSKMVDLFLEHFERHFRIHPIALCHAHWATLQLPLENRQKDFLAGLVPLQSTQTLHDGRFLGYEFLTWLWFQVELNNGIVHWSDNRSAEVELGERLVLSRPDDGKERVICTTQANALHEARTALRQGKQVEEVQLLVHINDNDYLFSLNADLWSIKGLKTPRQLPDEDEDPDGRFLEKMFFIEELFGFLNAVYLKFLSKRLNPGWESDVLPAIRKWIEGTPPDFLVD